jgi:predicted metal-dependent HD superfamily phosphohydrolase
MLPALLTEWDALCQRLDAEPQAAREVFADLGQRYGSQQRHYHNWAHIAALLEWVNRFADRLTSPDTVCMAVWMHDAIYNPLRRDNEERSAEYALQQLKKMQVGRMFAQKVANYVLATKSHLPAPEDPDLQWLLDFDLSVLGENEVVYQQYTAQIRQEYAFYPDLLYQAGRKKVLRQFLERPRIFYFLGDEYEQRARKNLAAELADS